jgi:hypothetical protein
MSQSNGPATEVIEIHALSMGMQKLTWGLSYLLESSTALHSKQIVMRMPR